MYGVLESIGLMQYEAHGSHVDKLSCITMQDSHHGAPVHALCTLSTVTRMDMCVHNALSFT